MKEWRAWEQPTPGGPTPLGAALLGLGNAVMTPPPNASSTTITLPNGTVYRDRTIYYPALGMAHSTITKEK
jgi:hypothetical protein